MDRRQGKRRLSDDEASEEGREEKIEDFTFPTSMVYPSMMMMSLSNSNHQQQYQEEQVTNSPNSAYRFPCLIDTHNSTTFPIPQVTSSSTTITTSSSAFTTQNISDDSNPTPQPHQGN